MNNYMEMNFRACEINEHFARAVISAFLLPENPTVSFLTEVKTAVSEAVTNAVVHAYRNRDLNQIITLRAEIDNENLMIDVIDYGCGIADIGRAMQPFFTTQPEKERCGLGFSLMQAFMDDVTVESCTNTGTRVSMKKTLPLKPDAEDDR